jgi:hypothetical protein
VIMKSSVVWDITPCSPLKADGKQCLPSALTLVSCSAYFSSLKMEAICSSKRRLTFNGLHGVISQKIVLFMNRYRSHKYGATNVAPTQKDKPLLSSKRRPHFQTHKGPWNEHKLGHVSRWGPKRKTTVLARASSNLLDWI